MLNIAVLVYNLIVDYNHSVVDGVYNFYKDKPDVRLIVAPVNVPHEQTDNYDYQYWTTTQILKSQQIDGIILVPNSFANHIDFTRLTEELRIFSGKPLISISRPIDFPNSYFTYNTSDTAYNQVIEHLRIKHSCKRIGFFGAGLVNSPESEARLESFKNALTINGLEFYPELVFQGDFTPGCARDVLAETIKSKEDVNFDAICCVNDFTAAGCLLVFDALGIKCPEDVILFGYDDSDFAKKTFPTLSSINQAIPNTGEKAAEMLYKILHNEPVENPLMTDSLPVFRQSCGCVNKSVASSAFYDWNGKYHEIDEQERLNKINNIKEHQNVLYQIYNMINLMDSKIFMDNVLDALRPAMILSNISAMMVGLYGEPVILEKDEDFTVPESARVQIAINLEHDYAQVLPFGEEKRLLLSERFVPTEYEIHSSGLYIIHPVFMRDKNYGYIFCKLNDKQDYILTSINLKVISDILVNAFEYSIVLKQQEKLIEKSVNLSFRAKTDELTQIYNRRGIMEYGQQLIDLSVTMNKTGSVFFCDLDGLKKINDTYGHKIGDLAIKTEADVLKACFREADLVGRLSGDEFCVVAPGFPSDRIDIIRKKLLENNKKLSEAAGLPFTLSISVGAVGFNSNQSNLETLLQAADQQLYEEKTVKHGKK